MMVQSALNFTPTKPLMENYWQLGRWLRIPVAMHWSVLFAPAWFYLMLNSFWPAVIATVAFLVLLVVHELGHVIALRWRKIAIERVTFFGLHGNTSHAGSTPGNEIIVAWSGVFAQGIALALALATDYALGSGGMVAFIATPVIFVFTTVNIFMMFIALIPFGPFDGHKAWQVIPWVRAKLRARRQRATKIQLTDAQLHALEQQSEQEAAQLMERLAKKK